MGQPKTTIELNGKLYDANTGAMVQSGAAVSTPTPAPAPSAGKVMDGFIRPPAQNRTTKPRPTPAHAARKPQHTQTLMRHVVKKPQTPAAPATTGPKKPAASVPAAQVQQRQQRAQHVSKSSAISRFGSGTHSTAPTVEKKVAHLPVQPHPKTPRTKHPETPLTIAPPITAASLATPSDGPSAGSNSFHKALENAHSHHQIAPRHPQKLRHRTAAKLGVSRRALNIASVSLVVVLLTGFVAYQSAPGLSMYLASNRAGFHGSLPGYTPNGFAMNGAAKGAPGAITVSFRSTTDNRSYTVTQKPSNWTTDSLRFNFFKKTETPTAFLDKGKTIYFYNNGTSAVWVNAGTLYQITGNANLSSDQVVSIADSL